MSEFNHNNIIYNNLLEAFDLLPDLIILKDADRRWFKANKRALEVFGIMDELYIGKRDEELAKYYPAFTKFLPDYLASDNLVWETGQQIKVEEAIFSNGEERLYEVIKTPIFHSNGMRKGIVVTCRDITERVKAKKELAESEEKYRIIFENTSDLIAVYNESAIITFASPSYERVTGICVSDIIGSDGTLLIHPDDLTIAFNTLKKVFSEKNPQTIVIRNKGMAKNTWLWIEAKLQPVYHGGKVTSVVIVSRDITKRKKLEDQLKHMAYHDLLTGVGNRRLFMEQLQETISSTKKNMETFSLMALDFDRFKWVNDTLGHDIGDRLLVEFSDRIRHCLRSIDTFARIGGDEFMILSPHIESSKEIEEIANRILSVLQKPWKIENHEFITTTSIGIAQFPDCGSEISKLMKCADLALYKAKQTGRNNYQYFRPDPFQNSEEINIIDIKNALTQEEFYIVYQPKYNLHSKEINSVEALMRWDHPERGLISPNHFIPLAEKYDFIIPITNWVLEQVASQSKYWIESGFDPIPISVNISPQHFERGNLLEDINLVLGKTGLDPKHLILEITESVMMKNQEAAIITIQEIRKLGIKIAIDDFGTGFSSLSYLMKLPVDVLKLDRAFIQELTNKNNISFVNSIITLAHNLNLLVVAEGIETEDQHQILNQNKCDIGQGYFFSKPLMNDELQKIFLNNKFK